MKQLFCRLVAALSLVMIGCATVQEPMVLDPVGPARPLHPRAEAQGCLPVYSATDLCYDAIPSYPHADHTVLAEDGTLFRRVRNATDPTDEQPARVRLPVGAYLVRAAAQSCGPVIVPVVIQSGRTTTVCLEPSRTPCPVQSERSALVRLPQGQVVGWRAVAAEGR